MSPDLAQAVRLSNVILLPLLTIGVVFSVYYIVYAVWTLALFTVITFLGWMLCLLLIQRGFHSAARPAIIVVGLGFALSAALAYGPQASFSLYLFNAFTLPLILLTRRERTQRVGFALVGLLGIILCEILVTKPLITPLTPEFYAFLHLKALFVNFFIIGTTLFWSQSENSRRQTRLQRAHAKAITQRQVQQHNEELLHAHHRFLTIISHELRTPMNGALGMAALLKESSLSDLQRQQVNQIVESGTQMSDLVDDLLDMAKLQANTLVIEPVCADLKQLIQGCIRSFEAKAKKKGLSLDLHTSNKLPQWVKLDAKRVLRVLNNLLDNAVKFTEEGGVILRVHTQVNEANAETLLFSVSDSGAGISKALQERIVLPFVQANASSTRAIGGTGLGLSISQQLIQLMKGQLQITSEPGEGSCFSFALPLLREKGPASLPSAKPTPEAVRSLMILAVDDNKVNLKVISRMLCRMGHTVQTAENGLEAVNCVKDACPDLIMMDLEMPVMDGLEATEHILKLTSQVKIIACTANAFAEHRARCKEVGMHDFVAKPFSPKVLREAIDRVYADPEAA